MDQKPCYLIQGRLPTGLRVLEKYATKVGGAKNHRMGLNDKILIKDKNNK